MHMIMCRNNSLDTEAGDLPTTHLEAWITSALPCRPGTTPGSTPAFPRDRYPCWTARRAPHPAVTQTDGR